MHRLELTLDALHLTLRLDRPEPTRTRRALLAALPCPVDLHTARIAGRHLLWHAPFAVPLEAAEAVTELPPGTFLYWPDRQLLELLYGPLQAERASVTVLGRLDGPIEPLAALGARILLEQGRRPFRGRLALVEGEPPAVPPGAPDRPALAALRVAREALWTAPPAELDRLLARRGLILPAGPLLMAESEARKLQELLWALLPLAQRDPASTGPAAATLLAQAEARLADLCGLVESARILGQGRAALAVEPDLAAALLEELVLVAGRLAGWLDERIPWDALNHAVVGAADAWAAAEPGRPPC